MKSFYAIKAQSIPDKHEYDPVQLVMYVLCNGDQVPVPNIVITGVHGDLRDTGNRYPFLILKDGRGDYGSACDGEPDRFFLTNLRSKLMRAGELFTVTYPDVELGNREIEMTFRIAEAVLLAGSGRA